MLNSFFMSSSGLRLFVISLCSISPSDFDEIIWCSVYLLDVGVLAVGTAFYLGGLDEAVTNFYLQVNATKAWEPKDVCHV